MKAIIFARNKLVEEIKSPAPIIKIAGVPIILRLINAFRILGVKEIIIFLDPELKIIEDILSSDSKLGLNIIILRLDENTSEKILEIIQTSDLFMIESDIVIDERLLSLMLKYPRSIAFYKGSEVIGVLIRKQDANIKSTKVSKLDSVLLHIISSMELDKLQIFELFNDIDYASIENKFYCIKIRSRKDVRLAKKKIIYRAQKGLHFTSILNKRIEDKLVYFISEATWITPNRITLTANLLALVIAYFFIEGWFKIAPILAYLVGIIDGLDGKLARSRGVLTKLGHIEHTFDMLYEQIWYISFSIGLYLYGYGVTALILGLIFLLSDTFVRHCYMQFRITMGAPLKTYSKFDFMFARIDGRRNVYLLYMILFAWLLEPIYALYAMIIHSAITAFVYAIRSIQHMNKLDEVEGTKGVMKLISKF